MNNKYEITMKEPLLRPGIEIKTTCSERYVVRVMNKMLELVREHNVGQEK